MGHGFSGSVERLALHVHRGEVAWVSACCGGGGGVGGRSLCSSGNGDAERAWPPLLFRAVVIARFLTSFEKNLQF